MNIKEEFKKLLDDEASRKKIRIIAFVGIGVLVIAGIFVIGKRSVPNELYIDTVASPITARVEDIKIETPYYTKRVRTKVTEFYRLTNFKTKWLEFRKENGSYDAFVESVKDAEQYGLNPDHYYLDEIKKDLTKLYDNPKRDPEDVVKLDMLITASFFLFTTHLIEGRIRQAGYGDFIWKKNRPGEDDIKMLAENSSGRLADIIDKLHPPHEQYEKLRKALLEYRKLQSPEDTGHPVALSENPIKPGNKNSRIPDIRRRLQLTDLKEYRVTDSLLYDEKLEEAVKQFQGRHGLVPDGIISSATARYLNQSFKKKADLIELNLERIRWLPREYGEDYISVNIPEYMMRVVENGKKVMEMRVVLGSEFNATPIFSDTLEYIVFSPTWNVPESILKEEMIPDLKENALAYDPERFIFLHKGEEIHPEDVDWEDDDLNPEEYRIVERPGESNSLGLVKFIMPNTFNIYMHDTPADALFKKNKRAYSHGCIRLERPLEFAKYLLQDHDGWNEEKMKSSMKSEEPVTVYLKEKLHVEIEYRTVWVDENGLLNFREDIYDHDKRQLALLNRISD